MAYHHTAFATQDLEATHRFYTEAMGFELAKVVTGPNPEGGWAKHVFYDTGDEAYIAFWELHDLPTAKPWSAAISTGMGLPAWVNHLAFRADSLDDLEARKQRWLEHGYGVLRVDHGFCISVYTNDPNGILVEFCVNTRPLDAADKEEALRLLADPKPSFDGEPKPSAEYFEPRKNG